MSPYPAPNPAETIKLPERHKFVSPMPGIEKINDSVPPALTVVAGFTALVSVTISALLFLKR